MYFTVTVNLYVWVVFPHRVRHSRPLSTALDVEGTGRAAARSLRRTPGFSTLKTQTQVGMSPWEQSATVKAFRTLSYRELVSTINSHVGKLFCA